MTNRVLMVNDILKNPENEKCQRILWIDNDYSNCYTIEMHNSKTNISNLVITEIEAAIENGVWVLLDEDPSQVLVNDKSISDKEKNLIEKAYNIVQYVAAPQHEPFCYYGKTRRQLIKEAVEVFGISDKSIYKYLRKYWQGGKTRYSLLSSLEKCGAKGKVRTPNEVKRGKPNNLTYIDGQVYGMNVDTKTRKIFNLAYHRLYLKTKQRSLTKSYNLMKAEFYSNKTINGLKAKPPNEIPTLSQYKYWYYRQRNIVEEGIARQSERKMNLNHRKLNSDSIFETLGPGFRYQIDATVGDVFLVNRIDRKSVIGRPIVYLVVDVFSRLIVGVHVCLEGPSWNSVSSALYNCMEDKVSYCKKYGIDISFDDWPVIGKPEVILADRAEMVGLLSEPSITNLKIGIENAPSYMGCAKGIVEQYFHVINTEIKPWLPGEVKKEYRQRGERDYRLDAVLDIKEFTQIIINAVLHRNKTLLQSYPLTQQMLDDGVSKKPTPIEIWNWGLKHKAGGLRKETKDNLRANLMRQGKATIVPRGIKFQKALYTCSLAEFEDWYRIASLQDSWEAEVVYDNRDMSTIFLIHSGKLLECELRPENSFSELYYGKTWEEIIDYHFMAQAENTVMADSVNQNVVDFNSNIGLIIETATAKSDSKNNVKNIRENRKEENKDLKIEQALTNHGESKDKQFTLPSKEEKSEAQGSRKKMLDKLSIMGGI